MPRLALVLPLLLSTGCIKSALINGQIEGTREGSVAFDTISDFELAEAAAASGMHVLSPGNTDALFLLTKAYTGWGFGFAEDAMEQAEDRGDRKGAEYHKKRAVDAYDRAIKYGLALLSQKAQGFDEAKNGEATIKEWLEKNFTSKEDGGNLFWTGYAWVARANILKGDDAEAVANLFIGVALVRRSVEIDPSYNNYAGLVVLGAYHARTSTAELDEAKKLFDDALEKTERKSLIVQLNYATRYACARADNVLYGKLLNEVLSTEDSVESMRLTNAIARRRAKRWLAEKRMFDACSMDPAPAETPAPAPEVN
jgi:hypothetical protein